jgi:hypothetical protein
MEEIVRRMAEEAETETETEEGPNEARSSLQIKFRFTKPLDFAGPE